MADKYEEEDNGDPDTSSVLRLPHLAIDREKLAELDIYDRDLKQLIYLLYAQLVHQTRKRELILERALSAIEPIRSELRTISRQLRSFEKIVWYSYYDLRNEKVEMARILSTVKTIDVVRHINTNGENVRVKRRLRNCHQTLRIKT